MPKHPLVWYEERNKRLIVLFHSGWTTAQLAKEFSITSVRVREILRWSGARRLKTIKKSPGQIMLDLDLDKDLVLSLIRRSEASFD